MTRQSKIAMSQPPPPPPPSSRPQQHYLQPTPIITAPIAAVHQAPAWGAENDASENDLLLESDLTWFAEGGLVQDAIPVVLDSSNGHIMDGISSNVSVHTNYGQHSGSYCGENVDINIQRRGVMFHHQHNMDACEMQVKVELDGGAECKDYRSDMCHAPQEVEHPYKRRKSYNAPPPTSYNGYGQWVEITNEAPAAVGAQMTMYEHREPLAPQPQAGAFGYTFGAPSEEDVLSFPLDVDAFLAGFMN